MTRGGKISRKHVTPPQLHVFLLLDVTFRVSLPLKMFFADSFRGESEKSSSRPTSCSALIIIIIISVMLRTGKRKVQQEIITSPHVSPVSCYFNCYCHYLRLLGNISDFLCMIIPHVSLSFYFRSQGSSCPKFDCNPSHDCYVSLAATELNRIQKFVFQTKHVFLENHFETDIWSWERLVLNPYDILWRKQSFVLFSCLWSGLGQTWLRTFWFEWSFVRN